MKVELANKNVTKLMMTGIEEPDRWRSTSPKVKDCPGLFHRALVNYYGRMDRLYNDIISGNEINNRKFKVWYAWQDGIKINIVNKNFGLLYTGSVIYGFKIGEGEEEGKTKHDFDLEMYYKKGKSYIKRNPNMIFELDTTNRHRIKVRGVWTGFRSQWKEVCQKEIWKHNLERLNMLRGVEGYSDEFIDGYSQAINEYLASL